MVGPQRKSLVGVRVSLLLTALIIPFPVIAAAATPPPSPSLLALGKVTYAQECAACHGTDGRGKGVAAALMDIKPRDFVAAKYRLVSTWERLPTETRGLPGTAMPSWKHLSERQRWGLVYYVKSFATTQITVRPQQPPTPDGNGARGSSRSRWSRSTMP